MIIVNVIKRFINIIPMQNSITQNDESAITYRFQIDRIYERLDLGESGWEWSIAWKNSLDIPCVILVDSTSDENKVYIDWTPKWPETAAAGLFEFQIRAKKDDLETGQLLQWNSQVAYLDFNTSLDLGHVKRSILEDYLDKFMQLCSTATIDAEQQRAIAAELALSEKIDDVEERITVSLQILSDHIDDISSRLDDFDQEIISNYSPVEEDLGPVDGTDTLDEALAKLQWQIDHISVQGTLPVSKGGTGVSSFDKGVIFSNGGSFALRSVNGNSGEVLSKVDNDFVFKKLSTQDLSDEPSLLRFRALQETNIDISRFLE